MARTSSKNVKNISNSEISRVTCFTKPNKSGDKYVITQNNSKMQFTLWKCIEDGFKKVATSKSPIGFDELIPYER